MQWIVERVCNAGMKVPPHVRQASSARGVVTLTMEHDAVRRRTALAARLVSSTAEVPPLFDVQLLPNEGGLWRLAGYEYAARDTSSQPQIVGQTWLMRPAADEDLMAAEAAIAQLARELHARAAAEAASGHSTAPGGTPSVRRKG